MTTYVVDHHKRATALYRRTLSEDPRNPDAVEAMAVHATENRQWPLLVAQSRLMKVAPVH